MLITNLGSLKAELAVQMFHQRFQPQYERAIQTFEAVANRRLRVRQMEHATTLTMASGESGNAPLPTDYLLWRTVNWGGTIPLVELEYVHPAYFSTTRITRDTGHPKIFSIIATHIYIRPNDPSTDAFGLHYYKKIPTITIGGDDNNSNWLLDQHPDLYFHGALFELFVLGRNGEAAAAHKQLRDEKFAELMQLSALTTGATSSQVRGEGSALGSGGEYF
jgi:hypothetical protein